MVDGHAAEAVVRAALAFGTPANAASASPAGLASVDPELVVAAVEGSGESPAVLGLVVGEYAGPAQGHCGQADESGPHFCRRGELVISLSLQGQGQTRGRGRRTRAHMKGRAAVVRNIPFFPSTCMTLSILFSASSPHPTPQSHLHNHSHLNMSLFLQDLR